MVTVQSQNLKNILIVFLTLISSLFIGQAIATTSFNVPLIAFSLIALLFLTFRYPSFALGILVLCMLLSPELSLGKIPGRNIVVRVEDLIIVGLVFAWAAKLAVDKNRRIIAKAPINKFILLYCLIFTISTGKGIIVSGINPLKGTFYILKYLEYFVIYFLVLDLVKSKTQIKYLVQVFFLTFAIVNLYGIYQHAGPPQVMRVSAPFEGKVGEPNTLGGYQVLILSIVIGLFLHMRKGIWRPVLGVLALMTIYPFIFTLSRSSYMAVLGMWMTFVIFHKTKKAFLFFAFIITLIVATLFLPQIVKSRIQYTFSGIRSQAHETQVILGIELDPSSSARVESWKNMFNYWKKSPLLGYGVTGLGFIDSQYIRTLVELGALGITIFLVLLTSIFRNTLRIYRNSKDQMFKGIALGFLAAHVGILIHAIGSNTFIIIRIMEPYWFLAAIVMLIPKIEKEMYKNIQPAESVQQEPAGSGNVDKSTTPRNANFLLT